MLWTFLCEFNSATIWDLVFWWSIRHTLQVFVDAVNKQYFLYSVDFIAIIHIQGRSCKQICWPPGFGGLQRVGLDPGQYDHHPHGVVHVGQLQDV